MADPKYVYTVPVIVSLENAGPNGYGFHAYLDSDLGIKARKELMEYHTFKIFKKDGIKIVQSFFGKKYKDMPYKFAKESWLLHAMCIPYGDACDLALDESALEHFLGSSWEKINRGEIKPFWVDYFPHNIDSIKQAQCLRELFLNWANITNSCLNC